MVRWCLWLGLLVGCARPPVAASVAEEAESPVPSLERAWSMADYERAATAVFDAGRADAAALPRQTGASGPLFERLTSHEALDEAFRSPPDAEAYLAGIEAYGRLGKAYFGASQEGADVLEETVRVVAAQVHLNSRMVPTLLELTGLDEAALRADPVRVEGLAQTRYGLITMFEGLLSMPSPSPRREILEAAASVVHDVVPFLLPEDGPRLAAMLGAFPPGEVDAADLGSVATALTSPAERHWVVAAFEDQHRAKAQELRARFLSGEVGAPAPVPHPEDASGTRFSHPSGKVSARFPAPPSAASQRRQTGGEPILVHLLQSQVPDGLLASVVCFTPISGNTADWALATLSKIGPGPVPTMVGDRDALALETVRNAVHVHAVAIPLDGSGCIGMAEYPEGLDNGPEQAGQFVASLQVLGD